MDRSSTTGYCTFLGRNLVTWKSKQQSVVVRSSAEVEFRAMTQEICALLTEDYIGGLKDKVG